MARKSGSQMSERPRISGKDAADIALEARTRGPVRLESSGDPERQRGRVRIAVHSPGDRRRWAKKPPRSYAPHEGADARRASSLAKLGEECDGGLRAGGSRGNMAKAVETGRTAVPIARKFRGKMSDHPYRGIHRTSPFRFYFIRNSRRCNSYG